MTEPTNLTTGSMWTATEQNTLNADVNNLDAEMEAVQMAFGSGPIRPQRNTIAAMGDSVIALGTYGEYQPWLGFSTYFQLPMMTHQRIRCAPGMFAISGSLIQVAESTQLPQVLAMNPLPGACIMCVNTGSAANDSSYSFATSVSLLKSMVTSLLAAGVVPILWAVHIPVSGTLPYATVVANIRQWNTWIRRYASQVGLPLIDAHTALAQVDDTPIPSAMYDTIHPNAKGHRLITQQAIADGLAELFPPNSEVNTNRATTDLTSLFNNGTINLGVFTTDVTVAGIGDGLAKVGGTGVFSLVAPQPADQVMGNWQRLVASSGASASLTAALTSGWAVGNTIAFSCRYRTQNVEGSGGLYYLALYSDTPGGFTTPDGTITGATYLFQGIYQGSVDMEDAELYVEYQIPAAATDLSIELSVTGVTTGRALMDVAEVTVRNLTTGGVLI